MAWTAFLPQGGPSLRLFFLLFCFSFALQAVTSAPQRKPADASSGGPPGRAPGGAPGGPAGAPQGAQQGVPGGLKAPSDTTAVVTSDGVRASISGGSSSNPAINELITVQDLAAMQPDLKNLDRLLKELGMRFYLEQSRDMTLFMPTDAAFSLLPFNLHALSWQAKWRIMQHHVIPSNVVDLEEELKRDKKETVLDSWEGSPLTVTKEKKGDSEETAEFVINKEARIVSRPPKIETFNGAAYKINKVLLPPSMTPEDLQPAKPDERLNPEINNQRFRKRQNGDRKGDPFEANEQQYASVDGTVSMERSARDPRLPGSFRPDPLAARSQQQPEFVRGTNAQHERWNADVYHRTPRTQQRDVKKPQDELLGFTQETEEAQTSAARIKVLGQREGDTVPSRGSQPALTRIGGPGPRASGSVGLTFESSERPETAPSDPVTQFIDVLLGGRPSDSQPASQQPASQQSASQKPASQQPASQDSDKREPSLFSMDMTPTQPPKVKALGLTEGLLPSEELITEHWSAASKQRQQQQQQKQQKQQQRQQAAGGAPIATLWQQMGTVS